MSEPIKLPVGQAPTFFIPYLGTVQAGFPSPANDYIEKEIDLNKELIRRPNATYYFRAQGDSMDKAFIPDGALLVIDRVEKKQNNCIVLAIVDGEFTVKRLLDNGVKKSLVPDSTNPRHRPIEIGEFTQCEIWGVVTHIITNAKTV